MSDLVPSAPFTQRLRISFDVDLQMRSVLIPELPLNPSQTFPEFVEEFVAMQALDSLNEHLVKMTTDAERTKGLPANLVNVLQMMARGMAFVDANRSLLPETESQSAPTLPVRVSSQVSVKPTIMNQTTGFLLQGSNAMATAQASPDSPYSIVNNDGILTLGIRLVIAGSDESILDRIENIADELDVRGISIDILVLYLATDRLRVSNKVCKKIVRRCELAFPERPVLLWTLYNTNQPYLPI